MGIEIERKFLLASDGWRDAVEESTRIVQAFLANDGTKVVRVRIMGDQAFLTVKAGKSALARIEVECEITVADAEQLLALCLPSTIDKVRHKIQVGGHIFEIDEFHGDNQGLIVAEVELGSADEAFPRPDWLGTEVTHDSRYANAALAQSPYTTWVNDA